jgi:two-component system LytT family sensor kinase
MFKYYKSNRQSYYVLFAIAFGFVWYLFKLGGNPQPLRALLSTLIDIFFSLLALIITVELLLPGLFYKKYYSLFFLCFILVIAITGSSTIISQIKLEGHSIGDYYRKNTIRYKEHFYYWFWSDLVLGSYFLITFIALAGFAIRLAFDRIIAGRQMDILEKEKSNAELEMLKNQINPHFLFNALNTIYYKIDRINTPARLMVEQFSSLLRYQLYECNEAEVSIEQELKFIADYIELQRERLSQNVTITLGDLKSVKGFFIAPFILMPLVENCFKHISQHHTKENMITVTCKEENGYFYFGTINTIDRNRVHNKPGIGLANVAKRLDLIYPQKNSLLTGIEEEMFKLRLKINIR